jgi:hypothetical protein
MTKLAPIAAVAAGLALLAGCGDSKHRAAGTGCAGARDGCSPTLQAAIDAAHNGDTIRVERGKFRGGVTIGKSVKLVGAGAGRTVIAGGGPVLTIRRGLRVSISGVTITGGVTAADPSGQCGADVPSCGRGYIGATALGGGVEIAPNAHVVLRDSTVTGNRAAPRATAPSVTATCTSGPCAFAQAGGGGIDNWGALTLTNTTVSTNVAGGGVTAQADGGGILSESGSELTLENSNVQGNRVLAGPPNARFATGGGVFVEKGGNLTVRRSTIAGNRVDLRTAMPASVDVSAQSGGIFLGEQTNATIRSSAINGNAVTGSNTRGNGIFCRGGVGVDGGTFTLADSTVSDNHVSGTAPAASSSAGDFLACGGALDLFADTVDITGTRFIGNSVRASTSSGTALVVGGAISAVAGTRATIADSVFSRNTATAASRSGAAIVDGGAIHNGHLTELRRVTVTRNTATALGPRAQARGGGIYSGLVPGLSGQVHLTLDHTNVSLNRPDQCHGC